MSVRSYRALIVCAVGGVAVGLALFAARSGGATNPPIVATVPARQLIVAVDLSGSRSGSDFTSDKQLLTEVVDKLEPADEVVLLLVDVEGRQRGNGWTQVIPRVKNPDRPSTAEQQELDDARADIDVEIGKLFDQRSDARRTKTDIFATLFTVADFARESDGRSTMLVLFSDMIQDAHGISFGKPAGIPDRRWIDSQRQMTLVPDLTGICVSVVGADPSTAAGVKIRDFWEAYLRETGADFSTDRYRQTVNQFRSLLCK